MGLQDVQDRIRKKKRKRRRRMTFLLFIVLAVSMSIFLLKAPYFDIKAILIEGNDKISSQFIEMEGNKLIGSNIIMVSKDELTDYVKKQPYLDDINIARKFPSTLVISVKEKKAEVNYYRDGIVSLLTREGILLEMGANMVEGVTLMDTVSLPEPGEKIYENAPEKADALEEFRYLQERNISEVNFTELDLRDMKNIRTYYNDLEIRLGYKDSLKQKLNAAINIISDGKLEAVKGYIDLSFVDEPVVFDEAKVEVPTEDESSENGDG